MANHALPTTTDLYTNVLTYLHARIDDSSKWYDSSLTYSNPPTGVVRWNSTSLIWEKNTGTPAAPVWAVLSTSYTINTNGTIGATTPNTGAFTTISTSGVAALAASSTVGGSLIATVGGTQTFTGVNTFTNANPIVSAKIGPVSGTQMHTIPAVTSDTIALLAASQTFTSKTYSSGALTGTFTGNTTLSGQISFTESTAPIISAKIGPSATQQHILPVITSDTIALLGATQTFTNKTLTGATLTGSAFNGTIGATTASTGAFTTLSANSGITNTGGQVLQNAAIAAGTMSLQVLGTAGAARDLVLIGQSGYSNGFTIKYTGSNMLYEFKDSSLNIAAITSTGLTIGDPTANRPAYYSVSTGNWTIRNGVAGGWAQGFYLASNNGAVNVGQFGAYGAASGTGDFSYIAAHGQDYTNPTVKVYTNNLTVAGAISGTGQVSGASGYFGGASGNNITETYSGANRIQLWAGGGTGILTNTDFRIGDLAYNALLTVTTTGNLGLGVVPSTWYATYKAIQVSSNISIVSNTDFLTLGNNWRVDAAAVDRYLGNGYATKYTTTTTSGSHTWYTAPSGTAGNPITFTQAMTLTGTALTAISIQSTPIGSTTPSTGAFTTLSASGTITALTTGTATNLNINAVNSGGTAYFGIDSIAGAVSGVSYAGLLIGPSSYPFITRIGSTNITTVSSTGLAVTGALSSTGKLTTAGLTEDTSGNLGLGVVPSAWNTSFRAIEFSGGALSSISTTEIEIGQNAPYTVAAGTWAYKSSAAATQYRQNGGVHTWFTAPSGTAGNPITFTQAMTLDASGQFFVNATALGANANHFAFSPGNAFADIGHASTATATPYTRFLYNGASIGSITQADTTGININTGVGGDINSSSQNGGQLAGLRNFIINGGFDIWQRGYTFASGAAQYGPDRWQVYRVTGNTGATFSAAANANTTGLYYLKMSRNAGGTSTTTLVAATSWESNNVYRVLGKTCTLSFTAIKGPNFSGTGGLVATVYSGTGIDGNMAAGFTAQTAIATITIPTGSISTTQLGTVYQVTFTVPTNITQLGIQIGYIPTGTAGAADWVGIGQVQLEIGSVATPFELRPYGMELTLCQRYYQTLNVSLRSAYSTAGYFDIGANYTVPMRSTPTVANITPGTISGVSSVITMALNASGYRSEGIMAAGDAYCLNRIESLTAEL